MSHLPAKVKRTGQRQLSISLGETQARYLEIMRVESGLRSWGQVVRMLISDSMVNRHKNNVTVSDLYRVDRSAVERQLGHPIKMLGPQGGRK